MFGCSLIYTDNDASKCSILGFDLNTVYNSTGILLCLYPLDLLGYKRLEIYMQTLTTHNYSSLNNGMCCMGVNSIQ